MDLLTRMAMLMTGATALMVMPGCETDAIEPGDARDDLAFRCTTLGGCSGDGSGTLSGGKGNTSFLGEVLDEGVYPLNELPLAGAPAGPISLVNIRSTRCQNEVGDYVGQFVSAPSPTVSVGPKGELLPLTVHDVADASFVCTVEGGLWKNTRWTIEYEDAETSFETELQLKKIDTTTDADGAPLYEFWVDTTPVPDPRLRLFPTCDEALDETMLAFSAYLVPGLSLDPATGNFTSAPDRAFLACLSGSIGKAWRWGYKSFLPVIGPEGHETAHNAIRAEYCGDDESYTQPGTAVWFQSVFTDDGPDPHAPLAGSTWDLEAVWLDDPHAPALCIGMPRLGAFQELMADPEEPFPCPAAGNAPGFTIPRCTQTHLAHEDAVIATWGQAAD